MAKDQNSEAAKKVADAEKASKKTDKKGDKPNIFARMGKRIAQFFKDIKGENKKIIWPTGKTVWKSTGVVIACVLVVGIGIWVIDFGLSQGIDAVLGIDVNGTTEAAEAGETTAVAAVQTTAPATTEEDASEASTAAVEETTAAAAQTTAQATTAEASTAAVETTTAAQ